MECGASPGPSWLPSPLTLTTVDRHSVLVLSQPNPGREHMCLWTTHTRPLLAEQSFFQFHPILQTWRSAARL